MYMKYKYDNYELMITCQKHDDFKPSTNKVLYNWSSYTQMISQNHFNIIITLL